MQFVQEEEELPQAKRHYGRTLPLGRKENGEPRYMLGPHCKHLTDVDWVFFGAFLVSVGVVYFLITEVTKQVTLAWRITIVCSSLLFLLSYLNIGFSVPGIASRVEQPDERSRCEQRFCKPCKIVRPLRTVHCMDCDVCITGHDHHCPWIGKCVGQDNLWDFYLFLAATFGNLIMMLVATVFGHE